MVERLRSILPLAAEGIQREAAAVLAVYAASSYTVAAHDDICDLMASALQDAIGPAYRSVTVEP